MTDDATQQADTYEFLKAQKDAILAKKEADENEWLKAAAEDITHYKQERDLALAECERLRADVKNLIRGYINTLESCRDRILMLGGKCDSLKTMELSDPHLRAARKALGGIKDRESHAFEDWLEETCPSGDVESVQWQWENSEAYKTFLENNND